MISVEEFIERLCRLGVDGGPRGLPRRTQDRQILIKSILLLMDSTRTYGEAEVNELLEEWSRDVVPAIQTDHATVRRLLVDYGHLERTPDGSAYRVGFPARAVAFDLEVDDIDVRALIAAHRDVARRRGRDERP